MGRCVRVIELDTSIERWEADPDIITGNSDRRTVPTFGRWLGRKANRVQPNLVRGYIKIQKN